MLYVATVWHMHQPPYQDPETGEVHLPWVRLHALKDYRKMAVLAERHSGVKLTFNLTPCLIHQLAGLADGRATDALLRLSRRDASTLDGGEKEALCAMAFRVNPATMLEPHERFADLAGRAQAGATRLTVNEVRDLQVWANLVWSDPWSQPSDTATADAGPVSVIQELARKSWGFSERDKRALFQAQEDIIRAVPPRYRRLAEQGQIELITSPFFHPILPLVCNLDNAKLANPANQLGEIAFRHPEHAAEQLLRGIAEFERVFGFKPKGIWLPEMSVSNDALDVLARAGIRWTLADSELLRKTAVAGATVYAGSGTSRESLRVRSHLVPYRCRGVDVVFRDREISDRIGFVYARWDSAPAADDLIRGIRRRMESAADGEDELLVVALDGENAWEHYPNDGWTFLDSFYRRLESEGIRTVTVSEYLMLRGRDEASVGNEVAPGSWIDSDFEVWSGSPAHRRAWDMMAQAATELEGAQAALDCLLAAECSDWYWWLSDRYWNSQAGDFEALFRANLRAAYRAAGREPPARLSEAIRK